MVLALAFVLALAAFDAYFTLDQFKRFGDKVEINPFINWLTGHVGATQGVWVGVMTPTVSGIVLLATQGMEKTAIFWAGMRFTLFLHQLKFKFHFQKKVELLEKKRDTDGRK